MKTLLTLILFLISMVGVGQNHIKPDSTQIIISSDTTYMSWGALVYTPPKDTFIQKSKYVWYNEATWTYIDSTYYYYQMEHFVNTWKAYEQECWNDSTIISYSITWGNATMDSIKPNYVHWTFPTFEDFMQYLERRLK